MYPVIEIKYIIVYVYVYCVYFFWGFPCSIFPSVLWHCWLGLL